jgi:NAD+ kinase
MSLPSNLSHFNDVISSMRPQFKNVALIGKYHASAGLAARATLHEIAQFLVAQGCEVTLEKDTALNTGLSNYPALDVAAIGAQCDLGLVVGGDGTMLGMGRQVARFGVPLIGINQGRLGFVTDIPLESYAATLAPMLRGEYQEDYRSLMDAKVMRDGRCVFEALAMNDVVVNRSATAGMVELRVEVDGRFVASQRADGLIIASPTGSTAYSLSAGGPLMHPSIAGWLMVPIAPHNLSNRPIVLSDAAEIAIEIVAGREASANFDMQSMAALLHGDRIIVRRSEHRVLFLHPKGWSYFDTLRKKLHWNEGGS